MANPNKPLSDKQLARRWSLFLDLPTQLQYHRERWGEREEHRIAQDLRAAKEADNLDLVHKARTAKPTQAPKLRSWLNHSEHTPVDLAPWVYAEAETAPPAATQKQPPAKRVLPPLDESEGSRVDRFFAWLQDKHGKYNVEA